MAEAEWNGTKTDWNTDDGVDTDNFNRIEENVQYNYENVVDLLKQAVRWKSGRYEGNRENDRFINVGFTPDIVMIIGNSYGRTSPLALYGIAESDEDREDAVNDTVTLFTKNHPVETTIIAESKHTYVTTNGFVVNHSFGKSNRHFIGSNHDDVHYQWVALKIGN